MVFENLFGGEIGVFDCRDGVGGLSLEIRDQEPADDAAIPSAAAAAAGSAAAPGLQAHSAKYSSSFR